jgi:hypothetical protein
MEADLKRRVAVGVFSLFLCAGCATSSQPKVPAAPETGKQVTYLQSASGINVQLLRRGTAQQPEALLLFRGVDEHPWAGKVVLHKAETCQYGTCYSTEVNGQPWTSLLLGKESAELYLPFMSEELPTSLSLVADAEDALKPEELAKMF